MSNALELCELGPLLFWKPSPWTSCLCIYLSGLAASQIIWYSCHLVWTLLFLKLPFFSWGLSWFPHSVFSWTRWKHHSLWHSKCGPWTNSIDIPWELWFSPTESESSFEQDPQGICGHMKVWETLHYSTNIDFHPCYFCSFTVNLPQALSPLTLAQKMLIHFSLNSVWVIPKCDEFPCCGLTKRPIKKIFSPQGCFFAWISGNWWWLWGLLPL